MEAPTDIEQFPGTIDYSESAFDKDQIVHWASRAADFLLANGLQTKWVERSSKVNDFPSPAPREKEEFPFDWFGATAESTELSDFKKFADQWRNDTRYSSSLDEIFFNEAYQSIMAMGKEALPWILEELNKQFGHWFYALRYIVRDDVAKGAKDLEEARQRWLKWGRETGKLK